MRYFLHPPRPIRYTATGMAQRQPDGAVLQLSPASARKKERKKEREKEREREGREKDRDRWVERERGRNLVQHAVGYRTAPLLLQQECRDEEEERPTRRPPPIGPSQ